MLLADKGVYFLSSLEYILGTLIAKVVLKEVGNKSRVHLSVKYWHPSKIQLGSYCEIRNGTFLDARSSKRIGISIGDGSRIKDYVGMAAYGGQILLGKNVLVGRCSTVFGHGGVFIGNNAMIGPNAVIISSNHVAYLNEKSFQEQGFTREAIFIGENVWIGANVCILAGSNIASNIIIGAGSVVHGSLESGWLYGGIPAKQIKQLESNSPEDLKIYTRDWHLLD